MAVGQGVGNAWRPLGGDAGRKHDGLWGRGLERLLPSSLELSSDGISGWALLTSPFTPALVRGWMAGCACPNEKQNPSAVARR